MSSQDYRPAQSSTPDAKGIRDAGERKPDLADLSAVDGQDIPGLGNDFVKGLMSDLDQDVGLASITAGQVAPEDVAAPAMRAAQAGAPKPLPHRAEMESAFQTDLGDVEAHVGTPEAQVGLALSNAEAATEDRSVMFLDPNPDVETVAHEVAHLEQGTRGPSTRLSQPGQAVEREAEEAAHQVSTGQVPEIQEEAASGTGHRSLFGGILGGIVGAVGGAVGGFFAGGPLGAVLGGLAGATAGFAIGDSVSTKSRSLNANEIAYAQDIYQDSLDYGPITITRDSAVSTGAPKTLGNTIHLRSDWGHFVGDTMELTQKGKECLIHEMCHVWQYQHGGLAYIGDSLWAQLKATVSGGDRGGAYGWEEAYDAGLAWKDWNPEQQAAAIEDYNVAYRRVQDAKARNVDPAQEDKDLMEKLQPYVDKVRAGEGAPQFSTPGAVAGGLVGAGFGAGVGFLVGGPVGAAIGGIIGGIGGALFGGG